jgi:hypothetical protein
MDRATVSGITAATTVNIDHAIAQLWNGTNRRIRVKEIYVSKSTVGAADVPRIARTTVRGTAGSTITPSIVHDHDNDLSPASGALLDLAAFSVQPTITALRLHSWYIPAAIGSGFVWAFEFPIEIPEGNGLALTTGSALAFPVSAVTFSWQE